MKVGIITHYYNSTNYGGVLQSYALCEYLNRQGVNAEQLCFDASYRNFSVINLLKRCLRFIGQILNHLLHCKVYKRISIRKKAFTAFRSSIPHSSAIYNVNTIDAANEQYDSFITGSDQVWHPNVINRAYSLQFAKGKKYSYAASIAASTIPEAKKESIYRTISDLDLISVRENGAVELLDISKPVTVVLDPVFLLSKDDWFQITAKRLIEEKYIFCYFLGSVDSSREIAKQIAHNSNCKIVAIPYLQNDYRKNDVGFGDYSLSNISPEQFLSLIYYADFVLTDSFHAICFSYIFHKKFAAVKRSNRMRMQSRIDDILSLLGLDGHFVVSAEEAQACMDADECISLNHTKEFLYRERVSKSFIDEMIRDMRE